MARQEVEIYFKVEGLDGYITDLNDLKNALGGIDKASEEASKATDKLMDSLDDSVSMEGKLEALEGGVKVLAGSFEIAAGALSILGVENNAFLESVEENVVGILALGQGVIDVTEGYSKLKKNTELAAIANKALNAVAKANPYVLLASALIAVGGALLLFRSRAKEAAEEEKKLAEEAFKTNQELQLRAKLAVEDYEQSERLIRIQKEASNLSKSSIQGRIAENQAEVDLAKTRLQAAKEKLDQASEIAASDAYIQKMQEDYNAALATYSKLQRNANDEANIYNTELARRALLLQQAIEKEKELARVQREIIDENRDAREQFDEEIYAASLNQRELERRNLENEYYDRINLLDLSRVAYLEDKQFRGKLSSEELVELEDLQNAKLSAEELYLEELRKLNVKYAQEDSDNLQAKLDVFYAATLTDLERQELALMQAADAQVLVLDQLLADKIISEQEYADAVFAINQKLQTDIQNLQKETAEEKKASDIEIAQASLEAASTLTSALQNLSDVTTRERLKNVEKGSEEEEAILKEQFERNKKFQIAQAVIATAQSVMQALSSTPPPASYILAAANAAAGALQIAAIKRTTFDGGVSSSGGNPAASINYNFGQQAGPTIEPGQLSTGGGMQPVQTYVLASDVTNAQQAQQQIQNLARL